MSAAGEVHAQNSCAAQKNCMSETAKTFHDCFSVFVLVFCFNCATAEIKSTSSTRDGISFTVLFQFYINCATSKNVRRWDGVSLSPEI